ncbi:MAG: alpha-amylase family glycosyl hydrolase [Microscillaceae bacterium]|nr:alpha-amylase family glycosyl hydrolase [Microscillaceae bacterium]
MSQLFISTKMTAQSFYPEEIQQGYAQKDGITFFIFSEKVYNQSNVSKVVVTGSFVSWSQDMDNPKWQLEEQPSGLWVLSLPNPKMSVIAPGSEFKFRINEGKWLEPPAHLLNKQGGNLVFMKGVTPPSLKAEIRRKRSIWLQVEGCDRPLNPASYHLTDSQGNAIPIATVLPNTATESLLIPVQDLDIRRVYYLEIPGEELKTHCSFDGWFREIYSDKELGANISEDKKSTAFRVFAPRAESMKLYLYKNENDQKAYAEHAMQVDEQGVWEISLPENLFGVYYDFTVHGAKEPGNHFYESNPVHISDPYARVSVDSWGKCRVWEKTKPATPLKNGIPKMQDVVAYEVHVQDFTDLLPVPNALKGTIPAMFQKGLRNSKGQKIGFDYLVDLGINTVHLMPVQEFLHWPDADWKASFENDEYMRENGIHEENYQWGYRTSHAFAVETRYRKKDSAHGDQRNQFRDLVQAFHDQGIAVIIDIVPNHTAENIDGQKLCLNFNALDKQYYYRTKDLEHIGEYGNEVKTENRPMVQRWLIDQCKHWIEEFGIDGFRIDLAGQIDQQTLTLLRQALGNDIIIYGEPWIGSNDPNYESNPDWDWYKKDSPITFFQDDARNAFKGPVFDIKDKSKDRGYAGGDASQRDKVKLGLMNRFPEEKSPLSGINYLDIHDNWTLADQFAIQDWDGRKGVEENRFKMAALMLFTSQGPLVLHGGTEMMRSKGVAVLKEVLKQTKAGIKVYLHGKRDTYNMRKANQFVWENVGRTPKDPGSYGDHAGMFAFWRGLIRFRLSEFGKIFRSEVSVPDDYYRWFEPANPYLLGYTIDNKVLVLLNTEDKENTFDSVYFPEGKWKLVGSPRGFDAQRGISDPDNNLQQISGGNTRKITLAPTHFKVWIRE